MPLQLAASKSIPESPTGLSLTHPAQMREGERVLVLTAGGLYVKCLTRYVRRNLPRRITQLTGVET